MSENRIGIGINENVYLTKTLINEKGQLELYWDFAAGKEEKSDLFESLTSSDIQEESGLRLTIWDLKVPDKKDLTQEKKLDRLTSDINATKGQLIHIMQSYMTKDKLLGVFKDIFDETPIKDTTTFTQFILDQEVLDKIGKAIFDAFVKKMADFVGKPELKKRLLLVRQSKDKAFATLRKYFLNDNPFLEDMDVPKEQSKLKFTKYELKEGLDDDTPVAKSTADKTDSGTEVTEAPKGESMTPEQVFGR